MPEPADKTIASTVDHGELTTANEHHAEPLSSVFSILHDIQNTLSTRFPSPAHASNLHPFIRNHEQPSAVSWTEEKERLRASVQALKLGVSKFRDCWRGERERVVAASGDAQGKGADQSASVDEVVMQRKTVLLRIMLDWCTLASPTDRIIALAQSIRLDVSLDNEDPSFGMGMETGTGAADEVAGPPSSDTCAVRADDAGVRVDTLALAGQRMVIDIEVAHPSPAVGRGNGWTVNSLRVERVDPEHLAVTTAGEGTDVDLPPADDAYLNSTSGGAVPGTRFLQKQSLVLKHYLQKYLDAVNRYNDSERRWYTYHETLHPDDEESLELQAERAILAFGDQLANLRAIDLKMQPLDALLGAAATDSRPAQRSDSGQVDADVDMDGGKVTKGDQVILWDQLNEIHSLLKTSDSYLSISQPPSVLPQFHPFPEPTFLVNPLCRVVLSETATTARFNNGSSNSDFGGWAIALDEPVLVSKGFFGRPGTSDGKAGHGGMLLPEKGLEDLCGRECRDDDRLHWDPINGGYNIYEQGSLAGQTSDQREQAENLDDELDQLLTSSAMGSVTTPRNMTVIIQPKPNSLDICLPITVSSIHTQNPLILNLVIQPNADTGKVNVTVSADASGDVQAQEQVDAYLEGMVDENQMADRLASFEGDVPRWLESLCTDLYG
ncbi:hypothetical protein QFC22_005094 [Naganishia vaughanmartiniae]|uniref:Uncharacterized protein n=1 Tax=Naganishia vaughanmartiniae TaxID=1424756 RepID=A0ACC2WXS9_9TREE|nr:hypothetical protein QFC22_005094 [Naganishia vaughanmartiniae]